MVVKPAAMALGLRYDRAGGTGGETMNTWNRTSRSQQELLRSGAVP